MGYSYTVITYGGSWIVTEIFNGIAAAVGSTSYLTMIGIASLFAFAWVACETVFKQSMQLSIRWFIGFFIIYNLLLVPKVTVHIEDPIDPTQVHVVDNVPWGLAEFASDITQIFYEITQIAEKVYSLPDDLKYTSSGMIMASSLVDAANQFSITDPTFSNNMNEFMQQCVFYDLLLKKYTTKDLFSTPNLWGLISRNASQARMFKYNGQLITCAQGVVSLNQDWQAELKSAGQIYGTRFFPNNTKNANQELLSYLPLGYSYLTNLSQGADDIMQQMMVKNAIKAGVINSDGKINTVAALQQFAYDRSQQSKRDLYQLIGRQAAYWLPIMKIVFESLLFGAFLFLAPLMLMPFGFQIFKNYIFALIWVESWAPLYAILNLVMTVSAKVGSYSAVNDHGQHVLTMMTMPGLAQINTDISYLAGYFSLSIPVISYYITKGGAMGFMSLSQYMGGALQSSASHAVAEETSGNLSFGNTSIDNHSAFNTNANHFDTNSRIFSGATTSQMAGGSTLMVSPSGAMVMDNTHAISKLGVSMTVADSMRASFSTQADQADSLSRTETQALSESTLAAARTLMDMSQSKTDLSASGESFSYSQQASLQDAANKIHACAERYAQSHGVSYDQSLKLMADAYVANQASFDTNKQILGKLVGLGTGVSDKASIGGKIDLSGSAGMSHHSSETHSKDYSLQNNFNEAMDEANRAVHDQSFRTSHEASTRFGQSISSSFDRSEQLRHDISVQESRAESFRQAASIASDQSFANSVNLSQTFFDWMKEQPTPGGSGAMGASSVEYMMQNRPDLVREYANEFSKEEGNQLMSAYLSGSHGLSSSSISNEYKSAAQSLEKSSHIAADVSSNNAGILNNPSSKEFSNPKFIDKSAQREAQQLISGVNSQIKTSSQNTISSAGEIQKENS